MSAPRLSIRLDLPTGRIGPGKIQLLELIAREGSIAAGGRALNMSYRRAWELVNELKQILGAPVVNVAVGGAKGGGATLTPLGESLIAHYRRIEAAAAKASEAEVAALVKELGGMNSPKPPSSL